ncbi:MAG: hypothetical protein A2X84_13170 [Desulfuromonadaceae bacterium GWC2_58_13]|nr:MAG: hypothetical protein A2X84_13170 [Desulfuromonadaceae bacterium GWC2_58_13]
MLLEELVRKNQEKPPIDWTAYLRWQVQAQGGIPIIWVCACAQINRERLPLKRYLKCVACGMLHPVRIED